VDHSVARPEVMGLDIIVGVFLACVASCSSHWLADEVLIWRVGLGMGRVMSCLVKFRRVHIKTVRSRDGSRYCASLDLYAYIPIHWIFRFLK